MAKQLIIKDLVHFWVVTHDMQLYSYTVMQLCSFKIGGVKVDENNFYYIYNNYIFSKKSIQDRQAGKK
jgi:hypothetical protein